MIYRSAIFVNYSYSGKRSASRSVDSRDEWCSTSGEYTSGEATSGQRRYGQSNYDLPGVESGISTRQKMRDLGGAFG